MVDQVKILVAEDVNESASQRGDTALSSRDNRVLSIKANQDVDNIVRVFSSAGATPNEVIQALHRWDV